MGKCEYVLAKESVNNTFEIRQVTEECGDGTVTCTKSLTVIFHGSLTIELQRGVVLVNGGVQSLPTVHGGKINLNDLPHMHIDCAKIK